MAELSDALSVPVTTIYGWIERTPRNILRYLPEILDMGKVDAQTMVDAVRDREAQLKGGSEFKGAWIPACNWLDAGLNAIQKVLLSEVDSFTAREQEYFKANETIAEEMGCSVSTIKRALNHLEAGGYIERVAFDGRRRCLRSKLTPADRSGKNYQPGQMDPADGSK